MESPHAIAFMKRHGFFSPYKRAQRFVFFHDMRCLLFRTLQKGKPLEAAKLLRKLEAYPMDETEKRIWVENLMEIMGTHGFFAQFEMWLNETHPGKKFSQKELLKLKREFSAKQGTME